MDDLLKYTSFVACEICYGNTHRTCCGIGHLLISDLNCLYMELSPNHVETFLPPTHFRMCYLWVVGKLGEIERKPYKANVDDFSEAINSHLNI